MTKRGLRNLNGKKAQGIMGMPFSVIFSIILIAIFLAVAIYAIIHFMGIKKCTEVGLFIDDFEREIDSAWNSQSSSKTFTSSLPSRIQYICFADLNEDANIATFREIHEKLQENSDYSDNMFFYPQETDCIESKKIKHIDYGSDNPYCIEVKNGKIEIKLEKGFSDALVKVS